MAACTQMGDGEAMPSLRWAPHRAASDPCPKKHEEARRGLWACLRASRRKRPRSFAFSQKLACPFLPTLPYLASKRRRARGLRRPSTTTTVHALRIPCWAAPIDSRAPGGPHGTDATLTSRRFDHTASLTSTMMRRPQRARKHQRRSASQCWLAKLGRLSSPSLLHHRLWLWQRPGSD